MIIFNYKTTIFLSVNVIPARREMSRKCYEIFFKGEIERFYKVLFKQYKA